jgi:hypothetical protein
MAMVLYDDFGEMVRGGAKLFPPAGVYRPFAVLRRTAINSLVAL